MHFFFVCFSEMYSLQGWNYSPELHYLEGDDDAICLCLSQGKTNWISRKNPFKWLDKLSNFINMWKRICLLIVHCVSLSWQVEAFKVLALSVGVVQVDWQRVLMMWCVDVAKTTSQQVNEVNHGIFERSISALQLHQLCAKIAQLFWINIIVKLCVTGAMELPC